MADTEGAGERGGDARRSSPNRVAKAFAVLLTLGAGSWALGIQRYIPGGLYPAQFFAAALALTLAIAYLAFPARRGTRRDSVPWYDAAAAVLGLAAAGYFAARYPQLVNQVFFGPPDAWIPAVIVIVLLLEALRRAAGWALVVIVLTFIAYALLGDVLPGRLSARTQDWRTLASYFALDSNGILGVPLSVAATIVVAFIFFGAVLSATGGARFFTDVALVSMGRFRGGAMKIAVVASALFGTISGSAVANVVADGVLTIPMIKRAGYPAHRAAAIEAVASTGGQLMPPIMGAAAFLMAEFLEVSYSTVALAALVPGVLYYVALFIQADLEAARMRLTGLQPREIPKARQVLGGWHFGLAFALLIYAMFGLNWQPERAALLAAATVATTGLLFGYQGVRPRVSDLLRAVVEAGISTIEIVLISAAAGMVIAVLNITGLSFNMTYGLVQIGAGNEFALLLIAAFACIVLGMGLPTLGVYVLLATLIVPALVEVGVEPIAAHLYVLYFGMMSMITPPVALAAFAAAGIAKADPMRTGFAAMRFGWTAYVVPFLFVASPALLLIGEPLSIVGAIVTAVLGVWLVSIAIAGYFTRALTPVMRLLFAVAGLLALTPPSVFDLAVWVGVFGAALGVFLTAREVIARRRLPRASAGEPDALPLSPAR
ncbi:MAG: TRAP transporter fused permease subunit [Bauldia sp.]